MAEFIIEYIVVQRRVVRLLSATKGEAVDDISRYHEQYSEDSEKLNELVMILKAEEDI